jgi:hypothetical protein
MGFLRTFNLYEYTNYVYTFGSVVYRAKQISSKSTLPEVYNRESVRLEVYTFIFGGTFISVGASQTDP